MMFYLTAAILCLTAAAFVIWPLSRQSGSDQSDDTVGSVAFHREQLERIDAQIAAGSGDPAVLQEERTEVARRLLRAVRLEDRSDLSKPLGRKALFAISAGVLILGGVTITALYTKLGSPGTPDAPLASLKQRKIDEMPVEALLARAEEQLQKDPNDLRGWKVVERVYARLERYADQERALQQIVRLEGESADKLATLARLSAIQNGNVVTRRANDLLARALELEPQNPQALYFSALAREQEGKEAEALKLLKLLQRQTDAQSQLAPVLRDHIARLETSSGAAVPNPDSETAKAIASLPANERMSAIQTMVRGLAARLESGDEPATSWPRLINAYIVLNETDRARSALAAARKAANGNASLLSQLDVLAGRLEQQQKGSE